MTSDLNSYLASRYLVADSKPSKKRKRKNKEADGLLIKEDDATPWSKVGRDGDDDQDELAPVAVAGTSAEFRKAKKSSWTTIGGRARAPSKHDVDHADAAAADAVLAAAAAENEASRQADDELPVVEGDENVVKMSDGTHAGLQSAEAVVAQLKKHQRLERENFERGRKNAKEEEVAYRDATGRRVDITMRRAEARRAGDAQAEKERQVKEALEGDVQREEARQHREQLEDAKFMTVARHADDEDLNQELKAKQRWNDPMVQFLGAGKQYSTQKEKKHSKGRPVYAGAAPPNRYGIKPGYRWDGVDRGTGFEAERFKAINRRDRNKDLEFSWQMDE
jgi:pre-mRNA-splicing factor CWC26